MKKNLIFVTGFFGAPLMQRARLLAEENGFALVSLDKEIEKADGRPVRRICMMMGEHEYRNKEYEALKRIAEGALDENTEGTSAAGASDLKKVKECLEKGIVVCCGDGVLHDDMSRELIEQYELIVLGSDMSAGELWESAKNTSDSTHAFMHFGNEEEKRAAFEKLYERQRVLFTPYIK